MGIDRRWLGFVGVMVAAVACRPARVGEDEPEGLAMVVDEAAIEGSFRRAGSHVRFEASTERRDQAAVHLEVGGTALDVVIDLSDQVVEEDAHGGAFDVEDRIALLALRDALGEEHPEIAETLEGRLLAKTVDRWSEVPLGSALLRTVRAFGPLPGAAAIVQSGCGGDGVTCLPGTSGTSWAVFAAGGVCRAESTAYGDSVCRGRCGSGCSWWDEDYTWDCLDHDVCLDYSSECDDEFVEAMDDWAATFLPLCWSGTSRSSPPLAPVCGNALLEVGEACDDGNRADLDGCSAACAVEPAAPIDPLPPAEPPASAEDPPPAEDGDSGGEDQGLGGGGEGDGTDDDEGDGADDGADDGHGGGDDDETDGDVVVDLGGWRLVQTASDGTFTFPPEIMVRPGDVVIVVRQAEREEFEAYWGVSLDERVVFLNASAEENGGRGWPTIDGGETFALEDPDGTLVDGATMSLDGHGQYRRLQACDDPSRADSWSVRPSVPGEATPAELPSPTPDGCGLTLLELSDADGEDGFKYEFVAIAFD